ncbi:hypothetical protein [Rhizobium sp. RU36D]|uniref:hypothetical protein n=1 Tax=Rhizobium sp. RU36D TaxID=1907415 RepID=UPI0009D7B47F|nr:hypothetical protein [Rhizobium sp. RU36D]SMC41639.1 hypothetical protein SAMN05880593_101171 [Rhizobium sp. RU36D]
MLGKAVAGFLMLAMLVQVIKPFGVPGFYKRSDFWKIAIIAFVIWSVTLLIRP